MRKKELFQRTIAWFRENMPVAETELRHDNPYQLMVAVILSAQCTDKRVNLITPAFFNAFPDVRQVFELFTLNGTCELSERPIGSLHEACGFSVSIDAIGVCILSFEQGSHPLKNVRNLLVGWVIRSHRLTIIATISHHRDTRGPGPSFPRRRESRPS